MSSTSMRDSGCGRRHRPAAKTALDALPIEWDEGENGKVASETIARMMRKGLTAETAFVGTQSTTPIELRESLQRMVAISSTFAW